MRFAWRSFVVAALGAALASGAAGAYTPYSQVRQDHPVVNDAVGAMPTSDINSSFNQISALLQRSHVKDLGDGEANSADLPPNFESSMVNALSDLQQDLKDGLPALTLGQAYHILQVVEVVAVKRNVQIYQSWPGSGCLPTEENPCPDTRPDVIRQVDALTGSLRGTIIDLLSWYNANNGSDPDQTLPATVKHSNFSSIVDQVRGSYGLLASGIESIDD